MTTAPLPGKRVACLRIPGNSKSPRRRRDGTSWAPVIVRDIDSLALTNCVVHNWHRSLPIAGAKVLVSSLAFDASHVGLGSEHVFELDMQELNRTYL